MKTILPKTFSTPATAFEARVSGDVVRKTTETNLRELVKIMTSRGYSVKKYRQSAMESCYFINQNRTEYEYSGWHGSGVGSRNYGNARIMLDFSQTGVIVNGARKFVYLKPGTPHVTTDAVNKLDDVNIAHRDGSMSREYYAQYRLCWDRALKIAREA